MDDGRCDILSICRICIMKKVLGMRQVIAILRYVIQVKLLSFSYSTLLTPANLLPAK